jgi:hypothetical protein
MRRSPDHSWPSTLPLMLLAVALASLMLASCGSSKSRTTDDRPAVATAHPPPADIVIRVGGATISKATYEHWMSIGEATVEAPKPTGPLPKAIEYQPPRFTACVAHLRESAGDSRSPAVLQAACRRTYEGIRARILNFLITGYWLRGEAARAHTSVSSAEVHRRFEQEREQNYPTAASFRRLEQASRQTEPDLEFAVETEMLSARLLARFAAETGHGESEQQAVAAFNARIKSAWVPRTNCRPGYVMRDCRQYR